MTRLIIVEDNPLDIPLYKRALENEIAEINCQILTDREEALLYFQDQINQLPKLNVQDIKLNKVDGFEFLKALRSSRHTAYVPVIFLSSSDHPKDIETAYMLGANSFLTKPSEYISLKPLLESIADYWTTFNKTNNNE